MKAFLRRFLFQSLILLVCLSLLVLCGVALQGRPFIKTADENYLRDKLRVRSLNFFMPGQYQDLKRAMDTGEPIPGIYEVYYRTATEFMPEDFAGHYLLGLCYQSQGKWQQAAEVYQKSLYLYPGFFWAYYNMGIIYWRVGQFDAARTAWSTALKLPAQASVKALFSDKLLRDIVTGLQKDGYDPGRQIQKGYSDLFRWISSGVGSDDIRPVLF